MINEELKNDLIALLKQGVIKIVVNVENKKYDETRGYMAPKYPVLKTLIYIEDEVVSESEGDFNTDEFKLNN